MESVFALERQGLLFELDRAIHFGVRDLVRLLVFALTFLFIWLVFLD